MIQLEARLETQAALFKDLKGHLAYVEKNRHPVSLTDQLDISVQGNPERCESARPVNTPLSDPEMTPTAARAPY